MGKRQPGRDNVLFHLGLSLLSVSPLRNCQAVAGSRNEFTKWKFLMRARE